MTERDKEELINDLVRHQDNLAMRIVILEAKVKDLEYVQSLLEKVTSLRSFNFRGEL